MVVSAWTVIGKLNMTMCKIVLWRDRTYRDSEVYKANLMTANHRNLNSLETFLSVKLPTG